MKHIYLDRVFAVLAVVGALFAMFHTNHAAAQDQAVSYTATTPAGVSVTLVIAHTTCDGDALDAVYVSPKTGSVHGCWERINKYQVLVVWDNGEIVAYPIASFAPSKSV